VVWPWDELRVGQAVGWHRKASAVDRLDVRDAEELAERGADHYVATPPICSRIVSVRALDLRQINLTATVLVMILTTIGGDT